jgi:CRISPR system Cascade subunit CasE
MYFSRISPAPGQTHEAAQQRLAGPYTEHQWLWRCFPSPEGTPRDFLFRRHTVDGQPCWYLVSAREPRAPGGAWTVSSRPYEPELAAGELLAFELRANPTVRSSAPKGSRGARHDVVMHEKKRLMVERGLETWAAWTTPDRPSLAALTQTACARWLVQRGTQLGFELNATSLDVNLPQQQRQHKPKERGDGAELQFTTVDLSGRLRVTDPERLRAALFQGVGSAKSLGCGLLLVRRLG